jgi:hypothetical protein
VLHAEADAYEREPAHQNTIIMSVAVVFVARMKANWTANSDPDGTFFHVVSALSLTSLPTMLPPVPTNSPRPTG